MCASSHVPIDIQKKIALVRQKIKKIVCAERQKNCYNRRYEGLSL